jgi:sporulation protein YlmC with PRC-barrel domain
MNRRFCASSSTTRMRTGCIGGAPDQPPFATGASRSARIFATSALVGTPVRGAAGEDLGRIDELMIEVSSGRIVYAVLSFGGFLGLGNKLFAIPWSALAIDLEDKNFVLDVSKEKLKNAPGFDKKDWPDMADHRWGADVHHYYGLRPYWE